MRGTQCLAKHTVDLPERFLRISLDLYHLIKSCVWVTSSCLPEIVAMARVCDMVVMGRGVHDGRRHPLTASPNSNNTDAGDEYGTLGRDASGSHVVSCSTCASLYGSILHFCLNPLLFADAAKSNASSRISESLSGILQKRLLRIISVGTSICR